MTKENKDLLLKDLCARLPYVVMCRIKTRFVFDDGTVRKGTRDEILDLDTVTEIESWYDAHEIEKLKPYLRSLSSMTMEEKDYYDTITFTENEHFIGVLCGGVVDWLNAHHFDYRGLIEKGLALEAPEGMYNN